MMRCSSGWLHLFLCSFLLLVVLLVASGEATRTTSSDSLQTQTVDGTSACPRCPLCTSWGTSVSFRLRFCNPLSTYVYAWWNRIASRRSSRRRRRRSTELVALAADNTALREHMLHELYELLSNQLVGQPHVLKSIMGVVRRKLLFPNESMIVHLAGDNGVGKTFTARLVSKALSRRCAPNRDLCDSGDNFLLISGTSFDGMTLADARKSIVSRIMTFVETHPHGVVLIDDLTAMDPALVTALAPLFGRGTHFPEQEEVGGSGGDAQTPPPLSQLLVFITTDFGQQGRAFGMSTDRIEQLIRDTFAELYGTLLPAHTRTYAYVSFDTPAAAGVIRSAVSSLPCTLGQQSSVRVASIDDDAVDFLVERHRGAWERKENGHALRRIVEDELVSQVLSHQSLHGVDSQLVARFVLDEESLLVRLRVEGGGATIRSDVRGDL